MPIASLPEVDALVAACHLARPTDALEPFDEGRLVRLARANRVSGLVYKARGRLRLSRMASDELRKAAMATLHRNLQLAAELKIALRALEAASVPVVLLKGAHFMDALYADLSERPLSDLDILVRPEDVNAAMEALKGVGYTTDEKEARFGLKADGEIKMDKRGLHELLIELHVTLNRSTRHRWFPMTEIWSRAEKYRFEGLTAFVPSVEDNIAYLCAHAVPHGFSQLIWVRDIAGLCAGMAGRMPEWDAVVKAANESHTRRATGAGLLLAARLGALVPDDALHALIGPDQKAISGWMNPSEVFGSRRYSTIGSLRLRARLCDNPWDSMSTVALGLYHKVDELRHGVVRVKQRGMVER